MELLACLGFDLDDTEGLRALLLDLASVAGERLVTPAGEYAIWRSRSGAELWFHIATEADESGEREIVGLTPFFEGTGEQQFDVLAFQPSPHTPFDGICTARMAALGSVLGEISFLVIDAATMDGDIIGSDKKFRVTAFASSIKQASEIDQSRGFRSLASEDDDSLPRSVLQGRITSKANLRNEATGRSFVGLKVAIHSSEFDIVASEQMAGEFRIGTSIEADCRLVGRLLD